MMKNKLIGTAILTSTLLGGVGATTAFAATPHNTAVKQMSNYHGPNTAGLAKSLGVSETKLKAALDTIHKNTPKDKGDKGAPKDKGNKAHNENNHFADLAKKLGIDESKIKSVMDANKPSSPGAKPDFAKIAKALGVSESKLKSALTPPSHPNDDQKKGMHSPNDNFAKDLAKALNISETKVKSALDANRPSPVQGGDHGKNRF